MDEETNAENISFTDDLNAMLPGATADLSGVSNTCGGSLNLSSGDSVVDFSGGALSASTECAITVAVDIPASAANGTYTNETDALVARPTGGALTTFTMATANLRVASISGTGSFLPDRIVPGESTNIEFVLTNGGTSDATALQFSFNAAQLASGTVIATSAVTDTCGGGYSVFGSSAVYSGGTVPAHGTCTLEITLTPPAGISEGRKMLATSDIFATVDGNNVSGPAITAALTIDSAQLLFSKAFDAASAVPGSTVNLTFTLENTNATEAVSSLEFTDDLGTNFLTGTTTGSVIRNSCGGTVSGVGSSAVALSDGSLAALGQCSIVVSLQLDAAAEAGNYTNTASSLAGLLGGFPVSGDAAIASLEVVSSAAPVFSKSFVSGSAETDTPTTLRYEIENPAGGTRLSGLRFTDPLGTEIPGATVSVVSGAGICGSGSALSGGSTVTFSGGALDPGSSCQFDVTVNVPRIAGGAYSSTTSTLTQNGTGSIDPASASLTITPPAPGFNQTVSPATIPQGGVSTLTFTVANTDSADALSALSFTAPLPAGVTMTDSPAIVASCGGTVTAPGGGNSISLSGGTIAAGASCVVQTEITSVTADSYSLASVGLSSSASAATAAATTLLVEAASPPTLVKLFTPDTIIQGETTTLTLTIDNSAALVAAETLDLTDNLPRGMTVAATPAASSSCSGGTLTAAAGAGFVTFSGGSVDAGATCVLSVNVTSDLEGTSINTTGDLTSSLFNSGNASDSLLVNAAPEPGFSSEFAPATILQGAESTLSFTIDNSLSLVSATAIDFANTLPAGVVIADDPSVASTCAGTLTASAGGNSINLRGGTVAATSSCTISVNVTSATRGTAINTTGDLTSSQGNSGSATASLTVDAAPAPDFSAAFAPSGIEQGATTTLTFTIDSSSALVEVTDLGFSVVLPSGLTLADTPNATSSCGGTVSADTSLSLTGGTVAAGGSCTVSADVTAFVAGVQTVTSGDLNSSQGNSGAASANLSVRDAPLPEFALSVNPTTIVQGGVATLQTTLTNPALITAESLTFELIYPTSVTPAPTLNFTSDCNGATMTSASGGAGLRFTFLEAQQSCFIAFDVVATEVGGNVITAANLNSSLGGSSNTTAVVLTVNGASVPNFTAGFAPDSIVQGGVTTLTYEIDNGDALVPASSVAFSDSFAAGLVVADTPNFSAACGTNSTVGTVSPVTAGDSSFTLSGAEVAAGETCTYALDVTSATLGSTVNTTGVLTSSLGSSGAAGAVLNVTNAPVPLLSSAFTPDSIVQGNGSQLTFTIDNSAGLIEVTALGFSQALPGGVVIATPAATSSTCGAGTLTATSGGSDLSFSGGSVAAGASCTVSANVIANSSGTFTVTSSVLASSQGDGAEGASATLDAIGADAPGFAKSFVPDTIAQGAVSTLNFTVTNRALVGADDLAFVDAMPAGMQIAAVPNASNTCGGTLTGAAGSDSVTFTGGTIAASSTCVVSVDVTLLTAGAAINETGSLTSTLGSSGTAMATLTATAADVPAFGKAFAPSTITQGETSTLSFTVTNSALIVAEDIAFADEMPAGMQIAASPAVSNSCGGVVTASAGASRISLSGGEVAAGDSCLLEVDVTLLTVGAAVNVTDTLTSSLGNSGTATATLTATAADAPGFSKSFNPASIVQGNISRLEFAINNTAVGVAATDLAFVDTFPAGLALASTPNAVSTCASGTITATGGAGELSFTGGTVPAGGQCSVAVNVTSPTVGTIANTSGALTSSLGDSGTATAQLSVTAASAPIFTSSYSPASIQQGGTTTLVLTIDNTGTGVPATGIGFNATFPNGLTATGDPLTSCGGTVSLSGNTVTLAGGAVGALGSCTVTLTLVSNNIGSFGPVTGALTSSLGGQAVSGGTSPTLVVVPATLARVTFVQNASEDGTYRFASSEAALNFSITTSGGRGSVGPIDVEPGTYIVSQSRPVGAGNSAVSCSDSDSIADARSGQLTLVVDTAETVTCTYDSITTLQKTSEVINSFLNRRNNMILSNGPNRGRRIARLSQGIGRSEVLRYQNGDIPSFMPVSMNLMSAGSGSYSISTSLYQVERAALMFKLAHDGLSDSTAIFEPRRFDIWFEAHYNKFKASQGSNGHFGIAYLGADYLVTPDLLAGIVLQFDSMEDKSDQTNSTVSGQGWMVGPYVTARVAPNLIFDGRLAYGQSENEISPFNTYTDTFDTDRWLIDASLSGSFDWNNWVVSPVVSISYIEERQHGYVDSLNVTIPKQTVSLGQVKFGPTFSTRIEAANHMVVEPSFTLNGIYNFGNRNGPLITNNTADETDGFRARIEASMRLTNRYGTQLEMGANYDGIGKSDFESYGANLRLSIPLQ